MSIKVISHVWEQSKQKGSALLMLLAIADNANEQGEAYPGIPTLAKKTRMSERYVQLLLTKLESAKELVIQERDGTSNLYIIPVPWHEKAAKSKHIHRGVKRDSPGGEAGFTGGVNHSSPGGVKRDSPKPSLEPSVEPSIESIAPDGAAASNTLSEVEAKAEALQPLGKAAQSAPFTPPGSGAPPSLPPAESEHTLIVALIEAWLTASGAINPKAYSNKTIRGQALEMHKRGVKPEHIKAYVAHLRGDKFWRDKEVKWAKVAGEIMPWLNNRHLLNGSKAETAKPASASVQVVTAPIPEQISNAEIDRRLDEARRQRGIP